MFKQLQDGAKLLEKVSKVSAFLSELENKDADGDGTKDVEQLKALAIKIIKDTERLKLDVGIIGGDLHQLEVLAGAYAPEIKHLLGG